MKRIRAATVLLSREFALSMLIGFSQPAFRAFCDGNIHCGAGQARQNVVCPLVRHGGPLIGKML